MTTTTSWLSVSGAGRKTLYFGADSQGTLQASGEVASTNLKKVFASTVTPEIFSFSGDAAWGTHFLRNLLVRIRRGEVVAPFGSVKRANEICTLSCARAPTNPVCLLDVLYGVRQGDGPDSEFHLYQLTHTGEASVSWQVCQVAIAKLAGTVSAQLYSGGLGGETNDLRQSWIARGDQGEVARTCFWSLCDLVDGKPRKDILTGGYPQLIKLDQSGCGLAVGVKYYDAPTVYGSRVSVPDQAASVWVDEIFTFLNPISLKPFSNAQHYGRRENGR